MAVHGRRETVLALVAIVAAAANTRIGVTEVGPLLDRIRDDTGMSATVAGALGSIPFVCMGVFAPLGRHLLQRTSVRRLITWCLMLVIAGTVARAEAPDAWLLVATTIPIGVGIAVAGVVLPGVVKTHFPRRTGAAMGAYVGAVTGGAAAAALVMVPLADALGGWRQAFLVSAVPTLLAVPLWLLLPGAHRARSNREIQRVPRDRRRLRHAPPPPERALPLAAVFGLQSMCFAALTSWLAPLYHHNGWSSSSAGLAVGVMSILFVPAALVIPAWSDRGDRRLWVFGAAAIMSLSLFGLAFGPRFLPWVWIVGFSIGNGGLFPLALTLPQDLVDTDHARTELTAWMLGLGYIISACGPLLMGGLLGLTGAFVVPTALLGVVGILLCVLAFAPGLKREPVTTSVEELVARSST